MAYEQVWAIFPVSSADLRTRDCRLDHLGNPRKRVRDNVRRGRKIYRWEIPPNGHEEYTAVSKVLGGLAVAAQSTRSGGLYGTGSCHGEGNAATAVARTGGCTARRSEDRRAGAVSILQFSELLVACWKPTARPR